MVTLGLKTSGRQFRRQFLTAIRGNLVRALTELITNSDDSYRRLGRSTRPGFGRILIDYDRPRRRISVVDWAEGMDAKDMQRMYPNYGAATSGLYEDQSVRGYFGKGLKDVLFSMQDGVIQSIKAGRMYTAHFLWNESLPYIQIEENPKIVTPELRNRLDIPEGNGTRVSFSLPEGMNLPRHDSLLKSLSNFSMLRLINSNSRREVILHSRQGKAKIYENQVHYRFPNGPVALKDSFDIPYELGERHSFRVDMKVARAKTPLTQSGNDREGGLLIYDEYGAVLDLTLFQYDREEHAARLFGWVEVHGFHYLLKADENVLTDTRDGLDLHHPFIQALAGEVQDRLRPLVERERHIRLHSAPGQLSGKQRKRLGVSIDQINNLLEDLSGLHLELGNASRLELEIPPEGGLQFKPKRVRLPRQAKTLVRLHLDTSLIPPGSQVKLNSQNGKIRYSPKEFEVLAAPGRLVVTQDVIIWGSQVGASDVLEARWGGFEARLQARVTPGQSPEPEGGLAFIPDVLRLSNNARRKGRLYLGPTIAQAGDTVRFSVDNPRIEIDKGQVTLREEDFSEGVAVVTLRVKGAGIGEQGVITADVGRRRAQLSLKVVSKQEKPRRGKRLITGYRFDQVTPSRLRASYDPETGLIWIYLRNPIVQRYFGDLPLAVALNTPHCQILLAEIILEQVAWISRRQMIRSGAAMYVSEHHAEEDLEAVRRFISEYGDKIHSWIADDRLIAQAVENLGYDIALHKEEPFQPVLEKEAPVENRPTAQSRLEFFRRMIRRFFERFPVWG